MIPWYVQDYGLLSDPSPDEKAFQQFGQLMGCVGSEKSTSLDLSLYVRAPPPEQLVSSDGWRFLNTGHGAGLVGFGNSSTPAVASFVITCTGQKRSLDIEYLVSYEGMGVVSVAIDSNENGQPLSSQNIDGLWSSLASVPWVYSMPIPGASESIRVTIQTLPAKDESAYEGYSSRDIRMRDNRVRGDRKFRLIRMQCC